MVRSFSELFPGIRYFSGHFPNTLLLFPDDFPEPFVEMIRKNGLNAAYVAPEYQKTIKTEYEKILADKGLSGT